MPRASGSQPPVSTSEKRRSIHSALYVTRSRVTPGVSSTTASRRPRMRFTSADLPDVRATDDRDHRQRREVLDAVLAERHAFEQRGVLVVELVVREARAQGLARASASSSSRSARLSARWSAPPSYLRRQRPSWRSRLCGHDRADDVEDGIHGLFEIKVRRVDDLDAGSGGEEVDDRGIGGVASVQRIGDGRGIVRRSAPRCGARLAQRARR